MSSKKVEHFPFWTKKGAHKNEFLRNPIRVCTLQSLLLRGKLRVSSQQLFLGLDDLSEVHVVQLSSVVVHKIGCLLLLFDVVPQPNVVIVVPFQRRLIVQLRFQLRFLLQQIYIPFQTTV